MITNKIFTFVINCQWWDHITVVHWHLNES